jgi:hypothetical protein
MVLLMDGWVVQWSPGVTCRLWFLDGVVGNELAADP